MPHVKRTVRIFLPVVLPALAATVLVAWMCGVTVDMGLATVRSADAMSGEYLWSVQRWDRPGATYVVSHATKGWGWGPSQATGPPDTPTPGDQTTAWASATADGQREWLCLTYSRAVVPRAVRIFESYCPGAVDRVTVFTADGKEVDAWRGADPTRPGAPSGISQIPVAIDVPIQKVKVYINSPAVAGWNEIDAVGLVGADGSLQWARHATASSSYGSPSSTVTTVEAVNALLPTWGNIVPPPEETDEDPAGQTRAIDGRGWPLPALWCERDPATGQAIAGAAGIGGRRPPPTTISPPTSDTLPSGFTYSTGLISPGPRNVYSSASTPATLEPALPLRIAWRGFLADTAFFALAWTILRWLLVRPWKLAVELSRLRHGRCIACGYDLGYDFRAGCPECGWRRTGG